MTIWFNHWFSTAYHYIRELKSKGYYVIASNQRDTCVYKTVASEFYIEPNYQGNEYLEWALNFVKEHKVDIFFVKKNMDVIQKNLDKFDVIGVKVVCERGDIYNILQDKFKTMQLLQDTGLCPEMYIVNNVKDFKDAYQALRDKYEKVCIKYNKDEGATSYRLISDKSQGIEILDTPSNSIPYDYICACLSSVHWFNDLIVMPYLKSPEISIDCLQADNGLIAIPRYKMSNRITRIDLNDAMIKTAEEIQSIIKLEMPYNVQLRWLGDKLQLLEINTRLSGGAWKDRYVGCNFPDLVVDKLMGKECIWERGKKTTIDLSNIESCVEI